MTLENTYNKTKKFYEDKYGIGSWQWTDEGSPNAILEYLSHCGEFTAEDILFAQKEGIWGDCLWILDDEGCKVKDRDFEIREDEYDDGTVVYDVYEQLVGDSECLESFSTREECERFIANEIAKSIEYNHD